MRSWYVLLGRKNLLRGVKSWFRKGSADDDGNPSGPSSAATHCWLESDVTSVLGFAFLVIVVIRQSVFLVPATFFLRILHEQRQFFRASSKKKRAWVALYRLIFATF